MPLTECMVVAIAVIQFMTLCALISIAGSLHDSVANGFTIHLDQLPRREAKSFLLWLQSVLRPGRDSPLPGEANPAGGDTDRNRTGSEQGDSNVSQDKEER